MAGRLGFRGFARRGGAHWRNQRLQNGEGLFADGARRRFIALLQQYLHLTLHQLLPTRATSMENPYANAEFANNTAAIQSGRSTPWPGTTCVQKHE
jgi:hypothetical protein